MLKTNKSGTNIQVTLVITKACYEAIQNKRAANNCTFSEILAYAIDHTDDCDPYAYVEVK
jgi:hypothetical protein